MDIDDEHVVSFDDDPLDWESHLPKSWGSGRGTPRVSALTAYCLGRYSLRERARWMVGELPKTDIEWIILDVLDFLRFATIAHLRAQTAAPASTLTSAIKRLEALGLVYRQRLDGDRRYVEVALTEGGRAIAGMVAEGLREVDNELFGLIRGSELAGLFAVSQSASAMRGYPPPADTA